MQRVIAKGPLSADILILGEAPGENEIIRGEPFVGHSGQELDRMLKQSGIDPAKCRFLNVCNVRPPENDINHFIGFKNKKEIKEKNAEFANGKWFTKEIREGLGLLEIEISKMTNLKMVIGFGNLALWAMTNEWTISNWRGSQIFCKNFTSVPFMPTYHPAYVLRDWSQRWIVMEDLKRMMKWREQKFATPKYRFIIHPSYKTAIEYLQFLKIMCYWQRFKISVDIETREGQIACIGFAWSDRDAICIPFLHQGMNSYWKESEEVEILWYINNLLTQANCETIGQNFNYDRQYIARRWGVRANLCHDTMTKQHLILPGVEKGLDFISSLHCYYHRYWKNESKNWDPKVGEAQLWQYNCIDAVVTYEANENLQKAVESFKLTAQLAERMEDMEECLDMMLFGWKVDQEQKDRVARELSDTMLELSKFINEILGFSQPEVATIDDLKELQKKKKCTCFNPASSDQVKSLAYDVLKLPKQYSGKPRRLTADKDAIDEWLIKCDPLYHPLLQAIKDFRSLQVFRSTFALSRLDHDGRWRCSINVAGPDTFRYSTSEDAFGFGTNMQNIPSGDEE